MPIKLPAPAFVLPMGKKQIARATDVWDDTYTMGKRRDGPVGS